MDQLSPMVSRYSTEIGHVIIAIVVIVIGVMMYRAHRRKPLEESLEDQDKKQ